MPTSDQHRSKLLGSERVVVKVATALVAKDDGRLALSRIGGIVEEIADLHRAGKQVMLVSSGTVRVGRWRTGMTRAEVTKKESKNAIDRQVCAAAGQEILMSTYDNFFQHMGLKCAQVLITQGDFSSRDRYFALMDTITRLVERGIVPVINENDVTVSSFSSRPLVFKDNDMLASLVASGTSADALALMTDVEGVFNMPPDQPGAKRISVYEPNAEIEIGKPSEESLARGRGDMGSKIAAASLAADNGVNTVIASGRNIQNISTVFSGSDIGTIFPPSARPSRSQCWLSYFEETNGAVSVRDYMVGRIMAHPERANLTLRDVIDVSGEFHSNEPIALVDENGNLPGLPLRYQTL